MDTSSDWSEIQKRHGRGVERVKHCTLPDLRLWSQCPLQQKVERWRSTTTCVITQGVERDGSHFILAGRHTEKVSLIFPPCFACWCYSVQWWTREHKRWSLVLTRKPNSPKVGVPAWCRCHIFKKITVHDAKRNNNLHKDKTQHVVTVVTAITICLVPGELVSDLPWLLWQQSGSILP